MLNEVITTDWPSLNAEMMRRSITEKMEELFLRSKNRRFVQRTEPENTLKECCASEDSNEPEDID